MTSFAAKCRVASLLAAFGLSSCMLFEPPELLPPADDACYASVTPDQLPTNPAHGDYPYSWICEATERKPMSNALHWFRNSVEYRALAIAVYSRAQSELPEIARRHKATGWFVIMDADETLLDNSDYSKEAEACGLDFWQPNWCDWSRARRARAVPGAASFTQAVHRNGGRIAIVTNRLAQEEEWTKDNLRKLGIEFDLIYLRTAESDKAARWRKATDDMKAATRSSPVPVMWVGDQITDFPTFDSSGAITGAQSQSSLQNAQGSAWSEYGTRFVLLPQPLYSGGGGWTANERK